MWITLRGVEGEVALPSGSDLIDHAPGVPQEERRRIDEDPPVRLRCDIEAPVHRWRERVTDRLDLCLVLALSDVLVVRFDQEQARSDALRAQDVRTA